MTLDPADRIWRLTVDLPAGQYEYKAALNGTWDVNYGAGGVLNGPNIVLDHPGGAVTFRYDNSTHVLSAVYASQQPGAVAIAAAWTASSAAPPTGIPPATRPSLPWTRQPWCGSCPCLTCCAGTYRVQGCAEPQLGTELRR